MAKKNLIVLSDHYLTFVKDQVETLAPQFETITVFVPCNPLAEVSRCLPVGNLKQFRKKNLIDPGKLPENVHVHAVPLVYPPVRFQTPAIMDRYARNVESTIRKTEVPCDLIHAHFVWPNGYAGARLKHQLGVPLVITAHGYDIYDLPFRSGRWKRQIGDVLADADHVITVSARNMDCIRRLGIATPASVIPNGFSSRLFFPGDARESRKKLGLSPDKKIVVSVGNLLKEKGYSVLIDALARPAKACVPFECHIIGRGPDEKNLRQRISNAGLEGTVFLEGGRPHGEIPAWITASDLFVLPSFMEGNPTVMFECLGCGRPFVGTRVGGIPEVICSGDYGLVVDPGDPVQLTASVCAALAHEWDVAKIATYASQFSWDAICARIVSVYDSV